MSGLESKAENPAVLADFFLSARQAFSEPQLVALMEELSAMR